MLAGQWERDLIHFPEALAARARPLRIHSTAQLRAAAGPTTRITTPPTGHYMHVEDPETVASLLRDVVDSLVDVTS